MSDKLDFVAQTSQRMGVRGIVLMSQAIKIVDNLGGELILPLPLNVKLDRLAGPNIRFKNIELVRIDEPQEECPMDDFPSYLESGYYNRMD